MNCGSNQIVEAEMGCVLLFQRDNRHVDHPKQYVWKQKSVHFQHHTHKVDRTMCVSVWIRSLEFEVRVGGKDFG